MLILVHFNPASVDLRGKGKDTQSGAIVAARARLFESGLLWGRNVKNRIINKYLTPKIKRMFFDMLNERRLKREGFMSQKLCPKCQKPLMPVHGFEFPMGKCWDHGLYPMEILLPENGMLKGNQNKARGKYKCRKLTAIRK